MPLTRYQIRNEYSLADPELYLAADKDDPEAILEGVAMSGLVGVLRQLGDLAEFAAEIFHDLHEEVMATAARGHGLVARVQQLEAEVPLVEKAFLSHTNPSSLYYNAGVDWHPNLRMDQNLITQGDLPRFVMDSYEECRGPPRLFILDKFDVAGAGACLKRYTNPSFFKVEAASSGTPNLEIQRDKKFRKVKRKGARARNGETPEVLPTSNVKLHQLLLEERVEDVSYEPARLVKLKKRQLNVSPFDSQTRKSMQKLLRSPSSDHNEFREISMNPHPFMSSSNSIGSEPEMHDIQTVGFATESLECSTSRSVSPIAQETSPELEISSRLHITIDEKELTVDRECKVEASVNWYPSNDVLSETDNFMDALNTLESEIETDAECRTKSNVEDLGTDSDANEIDNQLQAQLSDFQSIDFSSASEDDNISFKKGVSSSSYSDLSSLAEITRLDDDGANGVFSSIENILVKSHVTSDEILETSYHEHSFKSLVTSDETLQTNYHEHPKYNGTCSEVFEVPNASDECGEISNISDCANLNNKLLPSNHEASSGEVLSETFSVGDALDTGLLISDRGRSNTGDVSPASDNDLNVSFLKTVVHTESHPVDDLDYQDSKASTDSLLHPSSNSDLGLEKYSKEFHVSVVPETGSNSDVDCQRISLFETGMTKNDVDDVIKTDYIDDASEKNIIDGNIDNYLPAFTAHCSDGENSDNLVSKVDAISEALVNSEEPSLMIDATQSNSVPKQTISERKTDFLTHDINSSEVDDLPYVEQAYVEGIQTNNFEDIDEFNNSKEGMESALGSSQVSFEFSSYRRPEDQVEKDNIVIETIRGETEDMMAAVTAAYIDNGSDTHSKSHEIRWFSTRKSMDTQENLYTSEDSHEKELEIHESCSAECPIESKALEKVNPPAGGQEKADLKPLEVLPNDHSNSEPPNHAPDPSSCVQYTSTLPYDDVTTSSASSKQYIQQAENLSDVSGSPQIDNDNNNHLAQDCTSTTISSKQVEQDIGLESPLLTQLSDYSKSEASLPTGYLSDSGIHFEKELELQSDHADVECLHADKIIPILVSPCSEQKPDPNDLPEEICSSSMHESSEQAMPPLLAVFPSIGMFPLASEVCLEDSPPLPPLPPMQWRMGKLPNISPVSTAPLFQEHRLGSYPPMLPSTITENAKLDFLASSSEIQQSQNPILSGSDVKIENSQEHRLGSYPPILPSTNTGNTQFDFLASSSEIQQSQNPSLSSSDIEDENSQQFSSEHLQIPSMINDADNQKNSLSVLDPTESMIPFLNLPETPEMLENGFHSSEGTPATSHTPVLLPENLNLAPIQLTLENKVEENIGEKVDRSTEFLVPQVIEDQQHQLGLQMQVPGEMAWSKYSFGLTTAYENGKENDATSAKIPRPRNPLIDAVVAHDKSKLRKVTERPRPSIEQNPDERDSMLAQIRTKSFNLKPAVLTRPSIQGPKTNLKVAAILEKAKAIRQACAGSDEDDDDNWSDD